MSGRRDPVEEASGGAVDLYDIATWERRTRLDRFSVLVYRGLSSLARGAVILVALAILIAQLAIVGLAILDDPMVGGFVLLSVVPALLLAAYVWRLDVSMREPLGMLVGTFLLGVLFASFAAVVNTAAQGSFRALGYVGLVLFFFVIVGPVEETVKWLAVRLYAYRSDRFHTVLDGAVYGAMAGLGFATIENTLYIGQQYLTALQQAGSMEAFGAAFGTAAIRTFAGPGHVIYSAFAGYYLGLAKFNREHAGPIVVKGLLIAAFIHALYNSLVSIVPGLVGFAFGVPAAVGFLGFVVVYDSVFGYWLYRKIHRYRDAYLASGAGTAGTPTVDAVAADAPGGDSAAGGAGGDDDPAAGGAGGGDPPGGGEDASDVEGATEPTAAEGGTERPVDADPTEPTDEEGGREPDPGDERAR